VGEKKTGGPRAILLPLMLPSVEPGPGKYYRNSNVNPEPQTTCGIRWL